MAATASKEETNMQSNNPVFRNSEGFNGKATQNIYGNRTYPGAGQAYPGYGGSPSDPSTWATGTAFDATRTGERMSIDSVVQKTAFSLGTVVLVAALAWVFTGDPTDLNGSAYGQLAALSMVGGIGAFAFSIINSFKREISPALVLVFCAFEGLFVGAFSKLSTEMFGFDVIVGAVIGTFAAVAGTLAAYKYFNIQVNDKFRKFVVAAMFGLVGVVFLDFVLSLFGSQIGFNGYGPLGMLTSVVALAIAIGMLILDFDFVERGIAAGLQEKESWRAAFGLTVTIIWIYINLVRILSILQRS
jgi:uncharacterized YccA/Bax inhibitor family protein